MAKSNTFFVDNETLKDLEIISFEKKGQSLIDCYKDTQFLGGYNKLRDIFGSPVNNLAEITDRQQIVEFFSKYPVCFNSNKEDLDYIEYYLSSRIEPISDPLIFSFYIKAMGSRLFAKSLYDYVQLSTIKVVRFVKDVDTILGQISKLDYPQVFASYIRKATSIMDQKIFKDYMSMANSRRFSFYRLFYTDSKLRLKFADSLRDLLGIVYLIDAFATIAKVSYEHGMCMPEFIKDDKRPVLEVNEVFHPFLCKPVKNNIALGYPQNMLFLTGPNMAGKTTLLKAVGISVYLAHLGLPVPCKSMRLTLFNGLVTTINTGDNLKIGYSYYYSEVKRVKTVAEKMRDCSKIVWIGDELFRGTNIKDAFDASKLIITSFANVTEGIIILSSHLVELVNEISVIPSIQFKKMDAEVDENGNPEFTYSISDGVSDVRLGLYIIKKEGLTDIIAACK